MLEDYISIYKIPTLIYLAKSVKKTAIIYKSDALQKSLVDRLREEDFKLLVLNQDS